MTRKSKREIERALEELGESTTDPDVGRPIEDDVDDETRALLDGMTTPSPDEMYGESGTPEWLSSLNEEHPAEEDT